MKRRGRAGKGSALVLVDFIHLLLSDGGPHLVRTTLKAARNAAALKAQCRRRDIPVIYANDNFGNWRADFPALVKACKEKGGSAGELVQVLPPTAEDISVLKPRHSAFYGTPLEFLLDELQADRIILAGVEADICVMYTAHDAYMRRYGLWIPRNCIASRSASRLGAALGFMKTNLKADTTPASSS